MHQAPQARLHPHPRGTLAPTTLLLHKLRLSSQAIAHWSQRCASPHKFGLPPTRGYALSLTHTPPSLISGEQGVSLSRDVLRDL